MNTKVILALIATIACVSAHAVLKDPSPWNTQPSTTQRCGISGNVNPTVVAAATYDAGSQPAIVWQLIAQDGSGTVQVYIDTTGSTNPDPNANTSYPVGSFDTSALTTYTQTITIPSSVVCNGPDGLCTLMAHSPNWWSCAYVNITNCPGCPVPPPPAPVCTNLGKNLNFCSSKNYQSAILPVGTNPTSLDTQTAATFLNYVNNPKVFGTNNTACRQAFSQFICDVNFPRCGSSPDGHAVAGQPCHAECKNTMSVCQLTTEHAGLYDCTDSTKYPLCPGESAASTVVVALSAVVLAVVALL